MSFSTKSHADIIGAGFTGCATAHDLALRGYRVTVIERGDIAPGASGRTHGLLHSGGRYCLRHTPKPLHQLTRLYAAPQALCVRMRPGSSTGEPAVWT
jgi:glycerol-3-phosphate dehydrogenase